jgi:hypothetical protein
MLALLFKSLDRIAKDFIAVAEEVNFAFHQSDYFVIGLHRSNISVPVVNLMIQNIVRETLTQSGRIAPWTL